MPFVLVLLGVAVAVFALSKSSGAAPQSGGDGPYPNYPPAPPPIPGFPPAPAPQGGSPSSGSSWVPATGLSNGARYRFAVPVPSTLFGIDPTPMIVQAASMMGAMNPQVYLPGSWPNPSPSVPAGLQSSTAVVEATWGGPSTPNLPTGVYGVLQLAIM